MILQEARNPWMHGPCVLWSLQGTPGLVRHIPVVACVAVITDVFGSSFSH